MKYDDNYYYHKLEIDEIFKVLETEAILPNTKEYFHNLCPYQTLEEVQEALDNVDEAYAIYRRYERCHLYNNLDIFKLLDIISKGGVLTPLEVYEFILLNSSVRANQRLLETLKKDNFKAPNFNQITSNLVLDNQFDQILRKTVDDNGYILDTASKELGQIRAKLKGIDDRVRNKLQEIINANHAKLADTMVVIRNDRYCLCVKAEYKNTFNGILHDVSSSSLTAYIEPTMIAQMSNEKDQLRNLEKEEINKILKQISLSIFNYHDSFYTNYELLINLDILFTKAILASLYDGCKPRVNNSCVLNLKNARHPLLKVDKVIPNNVEFQKGTLGIVITGPNTGGKTVLLKTVGLLSLMVKFGLLIPCDEDSDIMIYDHIYCDIGDDQSIKENLSTFSSHMKKMVAICNQVTPNSLALFDEIGSGTDPFEGSALGIAVLKYFLNKQVTFIVTTHYPSLKAFAYEEERVVNASMEFNKDTYLPTYHLKIGKSGSSNAFNVAKSLGLKEEIIDDAINYTKHFEDENSNLIKNIEQKYQELSVLEANLKTKLEECEKSIDHYNQLSTKLNKDKEKIMNAAFLKANKIIDKRLLEADKLISELEELKEKGIKNHQLIEAKKGVEETFTKLVVKKKKEKKTVSNHVIKVKDRVYLPEYDQYGNVARIRKDQTYDVEIGNIRINLQRDELEYVEDVKNEQVTNVEFIRATDQMKKVSLTLDLRGARYNEAYDLLDKYIDDLLINNLKVATIIHGYGTGTIRELVRDYLKKSNYIKEYRYGGENEGGLGVTVITLK